MLYTQEDIFDYVEQEDVKFIRLAFCDVYGRQKNISIMPGELRRAFDYGISFDASAVAGFGDVVNSDLLLHPIASTLTVLPWRPSRGRVVKMFCDITHPDGTPFTRDCRYILRKAVDYAASKGFSVQFGAEFEFYLFKTDADGEPTHIPLDHAGYLDVAPEDKGEDVRRQICLTLEEMGIRPEASHHEEGPGQNEIDFRYSDAMSAADNAQHFITVVKAAARQNGLYADFSPKPIPGEAGSGMHINMSVKSKDGADYSSAFLAGILAHIRELTYFLNPTEGSYRRLGEKKAPGYITWSAQNRSQLVRIPAAQGEYKRIELRSPDPSANPYLAYALLIYAGLDGIEKGMTPPEPVNENLYTAGNSVTSSLRKLPGTLDEARKAADCDFIKQILPEGFLM